MEEDQNQELPPIVFHSKRKTTTHISPGIDLVGIRRQLSLTQRDLAQLLDVQQTVISEVERHGQDLKLSSIKRYVEASGGKLRLEVELPDGRHYEFAI